MRNKTVSNDVDPIVPTKFCKASRVPYAIRSNVEDELTKLEIEGIITPVSYSPNAAPLVPVIKSDKIIFAFVVTIGQL